MSLAEVEAHNARVAAGVRRPDPTPAIQTAVPFRVEPKPTTDEEKLNKTEKRYLQYLRGIGFQVGIQNITLKLADDCRLTPDFNHIYDGRLVFTDVKGFQREDALIKMKMAARQFTWADFEIVSLEAGNWVTRLVKP